MYIQSLVNTPMHTLRSPRFTVIALLAALCLLGIQQAAAFHAFSHLGVEQASDSQKQLPHTDRCDKCVVYAEISGAGPISVHPTVPVTSQFIVAALVTRTLLASQTLTVYSARAPPVPL